MRLWLVTVTLVCLAIAWVATTADDALPLAAVACNLLVFGAMTLVMTALGASELAWLPATCVLLAAMTFGYRGGPDPDDFYWWAHGLLSAKSSLVREVVAGVSYAAAGLWWAVHAPRRRAVRA